MNKNNRGWKMLNLMFPNECAEENESNTNYVVENEPQQENIPPETNNQDHLSNSNSCQSKTEHVFENSNCNEDSHITELDEQGRNLLMPFFLNKSDNALIEVLNTPLSPQPSTSTNIYDSLRNVTPINSENDLYLTDSSEDFIPDSNECSTLIPGKMLIPGKRMGLCREKCIQKFTEDERVTVFSSYWNIQSLDQKRQYIVSLINREQPKTG